MISSKIEVLFPVMLAIAVAGVVVVVVVDVAYASSAFSLIQSR